MRKREILEKMKSYPPFCVKVWKACMEIPEGETRSYKEIAEKIGSPKAARAVAMALKKNPFAPFVPCHRVIRSDGKTGGYSGPGGPERKAEMLEKERNERKR